MWDLIQRIAELPVAAGATYDALVIEILTAAGVQATATGNAGGGVVDYRDRFALSIRATVAIDDAGRGRRLISYRSNPQPPNMLMLLMRVLSFSKMSVTVRL